MPLRQNDELNVSQDEPVQGSRAGATVQLGIDYFSYARERLSAVGFKEELVKRLLPTVPRRGAPRSIRAGEEFGKFEIVGKLGKGGMAHVFHALDPERGQEGGRGTLEQRQSVALKVMKAEIANNPEYVRRFLREAANTALIDHPNVVTVHEVGSVEGRLYFTMEMIEGVTLKDHLKHNIVSEPEGIQILCQLVDGLVAAHERGIGHRDLKPSNLMLVTSDHRYGFAIKGEFDVVVKVTDFGLAQMLDADKSDIMSGGRFLGTAKYVAPEVVKGEESTLRSDVFSLGIMAFAMFAGRPPFKARNKVEYISANLQQEAPLLHTKCDVSRELSALVDRMLTKDPKDRPEARAVRRDLGRLDKRKKVGDRIVARDDPDSTFAVKRAAPDSRVGGPPVPLLIGGAVALLLGVFILLAVFSSTPDPPDPPHDPPVDVDPPPRDPVDPPPRDPVDPPPRDPVDSGSLLAEIPAGALSFSDQLAKLQFSKHVARGDDLWPQEDWRGALEAWKAADGLVSDPPVQLQRRLRAAFLKVAQIEGQAAEDADDFARALSLYRAARDAGVDDPDLLERLARAEARIELLREFNLKLLRLRSLALMPSRKDEALTFGRELLAPAKQLGKADEVRELLKKIESGEASGGDPADAVLDRAHDLLVKRDYAGAEKAIQEAEARWSKSRRLRVLRGRLERGRNAPDGFVVVELQTSSLGDLPLALYASDGPVTSGDYYEWFKEASQTETLIPPRSWKGTGRPARGSEGEPALDVQESHAKRYARAKGARLPNAKDVDLLERALGHEIEKPKARGFPKGFRIVRDVE